MKKILALVMVVAMLASLAVTTSAADVPTDNLIAHLKLDGSLKDEVSGEDRSLIATDGSLGEGLSVGYEDELEWNNCGVNGSQCYNSTSNLDGFDICAIPAGSDFTIGIWVCMTDDISGYNPIIWWGSKTQSPENWIGIWNLTVENSSSPWNITGPTIGSNDAAGNRFGVVPDYTDLFDEEAENGILLPWTHVVMTGAYNADTDTYTGTLYINGENKGSVENLPNPNSDPDGDAYVYANGANAWGDPNIHGYLDDVVVYGTAMDDAGVAALYATYEAPTFEDSAAMAATSNLADDEPADTEPTTEAPETDLSTEAPAGDGTEASAGTDGSAGTQAAPATDTQASDDEGGCGSTLGAAAAIVALAGVFGCAIVKKH